MSRPRRRVPVVEISPPEASPASGSCHRLRRVPKPAVPVARRETVGRREGVCHARRQGRAETGWMTWPLRLLPARKSALAVPSWAAEWPYGLREVASDLLLRPPGQQYRAHPARAAVRHPSSGGLCGKSVPGRGRGVERWRRETLRAPALRLVGPRTGLWYRPVRPVLGAELARASLACAYGRLAAACVAPFRRVPEAGRERGRSVGMPPSARHVKRLAVAAAR